MSIKIGRAVWGSSLIIENILQVEGDRFEILQRRGKNSREYRKEAEGVKAFR
jgi:hypothetical protein